MKILFNDIIQNSDAPPELKSPALSDTYAVQGKITITLDKQYPVNAIGIGNTDGNNFTITFNNDKNTVFNFQFSENGLYVMPKTVMAVTIVINTNASFVGRIGAGLGVRIPTAVTKEPSYKSTSEPRITLSGQVIPGAGGYNYRALSLDSRYKITEEIMKEIRDGYPATGIEYPYFIDLTDESYKLPFSKLYANEASQRNMTFQGGIRRYLYSKKFDFEERF